MSDKNHSPSSAQDDASLQQQFEELKKKCDEYLGGWQRALADYENLQRENTRRVGETVKYATEELITKLLPMVDHFKYAFRAIPEGERESSWLKGIEYIQSNFLKVLQEHGVEMMETMGQQFDTQFHEALEEIDSPADQESLSGTIAEEVASGFILNGKVIQHAKVKVYK